MAKKDFYSVLESLEKAVGNKGKPKLSFFDDRKVEDVSVVSWGIPALDVASNIGGCPRGKIIELFGPESGGKSFTSIKVMAEFQKANLRAALIDLEHSADPKWIAMHGVDTKSLVYGCDFTGDEALSYIREMCYKEVADIIVLDSTAALIPESELERKIGDPMIASLARLMSDGMKKIMQAASDTNTTVIFVNQIRMKPGVMWGDPEDTPGGKALKFYAHQRLRVQRIGLIKEPGSEEDKKTIVGIKSKVKFVKNKLAAPFGEGEFEIHFYDDGNSSLTKLVLVAYQKPLAIIKRKSVEGKMHYLWPFSDPVEDTGCESPSDVADWLEANGKVIELLDVVEAKAKEIDLKLPEEVLAIRAGDGQGTEKKGEVEIVKDE